MVPEGMENTENGRGEEHKGGYRKFCRIRTDGSSDRERGYVLGGKKRRGLSGNPMGGCGNGKILVCQTDTIEIRDSEGSTVRVFSDLGRFAGGAGFVYTNGFYAWFAAEEEDGGKQIWRLDLESGDKKAYMTIGDRDSFAGVNQEYLYYIVPGGDEFENTLRAFRLSDGAAVDVAENVGEVTVLSDTVITMGLRFDVSPVEMKVWMSNGSGALTVGEYVNFYQAVGEEILYLDHGNGDGYIPSDLKAYNLTRKESRVLAADLNTISFSPADEVVVYFAAGSEVPAENTGYMLLELKTGEVRKIAKGGTYMQFLCGDKERIWLGKETGVAVYDRETGQQQEVSCEIPEGSSVADGFVLNDRGYIVLELSDGRIDVVPVSES